MLSTRGLADLPTRSEWLSVNEKPEVTLMGLRRNRIAQAGGCLLSELPAISNEIASALRREARKSTIEALNQARIAARVQSSLSSSNIPCIFLKGIFQTLQMQCDLGFRGSIDLDILVAPEHFKESIECLQAEGAILNNQRVDPALSRKTSQINHAISLSLDGVAIDLHQRLDPDPNLMNISFFDLFGAGCKVQVDQMEFITLSLQDTCVLVASHGCRDNWRDFRSMIDFSILYNLVGSSAIVESRTLDLGVLRRIEIARAVTAELSSGLGSFDKRSMVFSYWTWRRHRKGKDLNNPRKISEFLTTFLYWILSAGDMGSLKFGIRRLIWLPSGTASSGLGGRFVILYPLLAPVKVIQRLWTRKRDAAVAAMDIERR